MEAGPQENKAALPQQEEPGMIRRPPLPPLVSAAAGPIWSQAQEGTGPSCAGHGAGGAVRVGLGGHAEHSCTCGP